MNPVLVGDVGGTSVRFALARRDHGGAIRLDAFTKLQNDDFSSFDKALNSYLDGVSDRPARALFALAGPPRSDGSIQLTNRDWPLVAPLDVASRCGIETVRLVNDFAAMSRAIPEMPDTAFETVLDGEASPGAPIVVTGPGTGFGVGTLIPLQTGGYHVLTGEGGHAAYAAHTVREADIAEHLAARHGYVSTEMIVSGAWLHPVYEVIADLHNQPVEALSAGEMLDRASAGDPVCEELCRFRARAIMGAAGDVALITGGRGGVVLTGGVAERMVPWLQAPEARDRFRERGSHAAYMTPIPVRVLKSPEAPVIGAAALLFDEDLTS